jgi:acetylornithine/N-succinyldiaminopimelate aminotransferase
MENPVTSILWYPGHELILEDIVRAENCSLFDSRGKRYVDLESGVWCTSIGHAHPRIVKVLAEQPARIAHTGFGYTSAVVEEAATEVLSLLGFDGGKCVFLASGSEAVEYGVRVARMLSDRPLFLTMTDSYFGAYGSASTKHGDEWYCFDWMGCRNCPPERGCDEHCERWAEIPFDRIGGFLFEPGSSSGLVRFPPKPLVEKLARTVQQSGGFVLVNEVTTGVGRTGAWFGYQNYGIGPDIVAMGKGIGNGYPVSVTAFGRRPMEKLGDRPVKYAQSHQNDPLGAAVACEVIRVIRDEGLIERGREIAALLVVGLQRIQTRTKRIREIRARGLMLAVELKDTPDYALTTRVHRELIQRGFITCRRPGVSVLRLDPALTIDRADIAAFLTALEETLAEAPPTP